MELTKRLSRASCVFLVLAWGAISSKAAAQIIPSFENDKLLVTLTVDIAAQPPIGVQSTGLPCVDSIGSVLGLLRVEKTFSPPLSPALLAIYNDLQMWKYYVFVFSDSIDITSAQQALSNCPYVSNVELSEIAIPQVRFPDDGGFWDQWGLHNANDYDVDAPEAWELDTTSIPVRIAIVDSGIDSTHEDLNFNFWRNPTDSSINGVDEDANSYTDDKAGWNAFAQTPNNQPAWDSVGNQQDYDRIAHGTLVAGVLGSTANNYTSYWTNIVGIDWTCNMMNVKCTNLRGFGDPSSFARGIQYAVYAGAKVISCSWGFTTNLSNLRVAVDMADSAGCLVVAAANGVSSHLIYPAAWENVLMVGRYGQDLCTTEHNALDSTSVVAPGFDVLTTSKPVWVWHQEPPPELIGDYYLTVSGTSLATPIVAGIAGLVLAERYRLCTQWLSDEEVMDVILKSAQDTLCPQDPPGVDIKYGWGHVNAARAMVAISHGNVNQDNRVNISDAVYIISYVFVPGSPPPVPYFCLGDANCSDGKVNVADATYIINYVNVPGAPPPPVCYRDLPE